MKTRAKIREEEDERAANAAPVRTSTRVTRSNSNANGREAGQSMLQGGSSTGTAGSTAVETVGVTRKRASTSQARKDAATAAAPAAAVATAAHTKQRRVARKDAAASSSTAVTPPVEEEEAAASSSTQPIHIDTTTRRLTRAQHRAANSVSPSIAAHVTDPMEGSDKSKKVVSPGSRTQSGRVTKKGSTSAGAGSSSSTAPTRAATAARRGGAAAAAAAPPAPVANALAAAANRAGTAADARDSPFRIILGMMDDLDGVNLTGTDHAAIQAFIQAQYDDFRQQVNGSGGAADAAAAGSSNSAATATAAAAAASGGTVAGGASSIVAPTTTSMLLESMAHAQAQGGSGSASRGGARSAASNFIGNLVPRMQHLLGGHREGAQGTIIQLPPQLYNAQQQLRLFQQQQQQAPPPPPAPLPYVMQQQPPQPPPQPQPFLYQPHQSVIVRQDGTTGPAPAPTNVVAADYCWPFPGTSTSSIPAPPPMQQMQQTLPPPAASSIYDPLRVNIQPPVQPQLPPQQQQQPGRQGFEFDRNGMLQFMPDDDEDEMGGGGQRDGEEAMDTQESMGEEMDRKRRELMAMIDMQTARSDRERIGGGLFGGSGSAASAALYAEFGLVHSSIRTNDARVTTILEGLKSSNEMKQQDAAMELADLLLMGNEDSLPPNLPIREIVTMVVQLLQKEHNFELMLTAARCLTNMLEALPRAQPVVIEAVPYLLEKLKRIECIDVAEQSLAALEVMSRRNGKNIMAAGGIAATISHIDFFPLASQRLAFSIASNCALFVSHSDFHLVRDSLSELTQRMINGACAEDKRCLDSICTLFARLIENLRSHPDKLREVAGSNHTLLSNMQQLLLAQPSLLSSQTFPLVVKSVRTMAAKCSDIAVALIDNHFATTLRQLFIGHGKREGDGLHMDIVSRPANQLAELVYLTGEMFPRLPTTGIFEIDAVAAGCNRDGASSKQPIVGAEWFWRDDDGMWQPYRAAESRLLENARAQGMPETHLNAGGNMYQMDLTNMRQSNTLTGTTRELMRRAPNPAPAVKKEEPASASTEEDARLVKVQSDGEKMESVARLLFPVLVEIDGSSVGPSLRYESLRVMLRIVCPTPSGVLRGVLADLPLSGHIASALASQRSKDVCVVVAALQLVHMLLEKMADVYGPLFRKEGVSHEVAKLAAMSLSSSSEGSPSSTGSASGGPSTSKSAPPSGVASPALGTSDATTSGGSKRATGRRGAKAKKEEEAAATTAASTSPATAASPAADAASSSSTSTAPVTRSNRQRKRNSPDVSPSSSSSNKEKSRRKSSSSTFLSALRLPSFRGSPSSSASSVNGSPSTSTAAPITAASSGTSPSSSSAVTTSSAAARAELASIYSQYTSQLAQVTSSRRAAAAASGGAAAAAATASSVQLSSGQKEKMRAWIKKEAELLMKTYLGEGVGVSSTSMVALEECAGRLEGREEKGLNELYELLQKEQLSAFEMKQSGVIGGLHTYLTSMEGGEGERKKRLIDFARVFMKIEEKNGEQMRPTGVDGSFQVFEALVQKTLASVSLLEQFQVSDMGGIATGGVGGCLRGAQALRFFQTHQIRCNLRRHPACRDLSDWRHGHGSIKVDPLTSISAIERYLSERGIGYVRNSTGGSAGGMEDSSGEDELSDEDGEGGVMGGAAAAAANGTGEEKKIEIVIGDTSLPGSISILQALRQYSPLMQEEGGGGGAIGQSLWMSTHTLYYRSVAPKEEMTQGSRPSATSPNSVTPLSSSPAAPVLKDRKQKVADKLWIEGEVESIESPLWSHIHTGLPVDMEDPCASSLQLLRALYGLNKYWFALFDMDAMLPSTFAPIIPTSSFVCSKLSAKLQRQLSDFISVATQQIPKWTTDLVKVAPFIFPFAMRRSLLYCTAFGRDRALMHLVNSTDGGGGADSHETGRGLTPRLERKKVSIKRDDLIKSAEGALAACSGHRAMLEVSFEGEAGTGFGPTLEFYSAISKELQLASLKLWSGAIVKGVGDDIDVEYISAPYGLHPNAVAYGLKSSGGSSRVKKFELIGRLMAQSLIDARMLDLPLSPLFHSWLIGDQARVGLPELELLDPQLYKSLRALTLTDEADFEHLEQYFTLPGNESFELMKGGKNKPVTKANCMQYVKLVVRWRLREGVSREMEAMRRGFCSIVDSTHLSIFTADELDQLFCGCPDDAGDKVWGAEAIASAIKPDHGYSHDSDQIKWLVQMLTSFNKEEQRRFIQFCTGSPRLPVGGFRALNPPLTIVRKSPAYGSSDEELPSAMTCYNYLKVPPYSSYEIFFERFSVALQFVTSFHLT